MGIYEKAARVAGEFTRDTIERGRRRVAELVRVDAPPVRSGRIPNPADYLGGVDDSALFRNPAIRRPEDIQPEAILVQMGSEIPRAPSVKRRLAARGEADRYLNLIAEVADLPERRDETVHRKHAVGHDEFEAGFGGVGGLELGLEIGEVAVFVAETLGLAEADAVDDRGMV